MQQNNQYYVYIMTNKSGTLYVGMTNDIKRGFMNIRTNLLPASQKNITSIGRFTSRHSVMLILPLPEKRLSKAGCGKRKST